MSKNISELMQMIVGLGQLKNQRRELDLRERQMAEQAKQAGIATDFNKFIKFVDLAEKGSRQAREGMAQAAEALAPEYREMFLSMLTGQPVSRETQIAQNMEAGTASMNPQQRTTLQQETANIQNTGMNAGQVGTSQFIGQIAGMAQPTPEQAGRWSERTASGMTPFAAATDQSAVEQGLAPSAARIQAGTQMTAAQSASNAVANRQVTVEEEKAKIWAEIQGWELEMNKRIAETKQQTGGTLPPEKQLEIIGEARQLAQWAADASVPEDTRQWAIRNINQIYAAAGLEHLMIQPGGLEPMNPLGRMIQRGNQVPLQSVPFNHQYQHGPQQQSPMTPSANAMPWVRP